MSKDSENPKKRSSAQAKEVTLEEKISVLAKWSVASKRIFELEKELKETREIKEKLEKNFDWLAQVKGIVRKDTMKPRSAQVESKEEEEEPRPKVKKAETPKKKQKVVGTPDSDKPGSNPDIEKKIEKLREKNLIPRNKEFAPTFRELDDKDTEFTEFGSME